MLEQPPERSLSVIEANVSTNESIEFRPNGCVRLILWCMPTLLFYGFFFVVGGFVNVLGLPAKGATVNCLFAFVTLGSSFCLGYFDAFFSENVMSHSSVKRRKKILLHAAKFVSWQILLIPTISLLFLGAGMAISFLE